MMLRNCFAALAAVALAAGLAGCKGAVATASGNEGTAGTTTVKYPDRPALLIEKSSYDVGKIENEKGHELKVEIANEGGKPLLIREVIAGCRCTVPKFPYEVPPGGKATIDVRLEPDMLWKGKRDFSFTVVTNDPQVDKRRVEVFGELDPILMVMPNPSQRVHFKPGEEVSGHYTLRPRPDRKMRIVDMTNSSDRVQAKITGPDQDGDYRLEFSMPGKREPGDVWAYLTVETDDPVVNTATMKVEAQALEGPISNPPTVEKAVIAAGAKDIELAELKVWERMGAVQVKKVEGGPGLRFEINPVANNMRARVKVFYMGGWKPGKDVRTDIKIHTDSKKYPVLTVPLTVKTVV